MENGAYRFINWNIHHITQKNNITIIISFIHNANYKHYSILPLQMNNNYIIKRNLAYEINMIKRMCYLGPSEPPAGNFFLMLHWGEYFPNLFQRIFANLKIYNFYNLI